MNIQEIQLKSFPLVIITDTHTNLKNIDLVRAQYPNSQIISLGDFSFLFSKPGEKYNHNSINYFIKHQIPALRGNHEEHLINCWKSDNGDSLIQFRAVSFFEEGSLFNHYNLEKHQIDYLNNLPIGFKIILPDGSNYLCFHNEPRDLWNFNRDIIEDEFLNIYPIDNRTRAVVKGHLHENIILNFPNISCKLITIGQLCNSDHHSGINNGKNYALLTENGIEFKKI